MKTFAIALFLSALTLGAGSSSAQESDAELRLSVVDPAGLGVRTTVELTSDGTHFNRITSTTDSGHLVVRRLPYGVYRIQVSEKGFAPASRVVELQSPLPVSLTIQLEVAEVSTAVTVQGSTLVDPEQVSSNNQIGTQFIENRPASLPGRSVQDLVNTQPGWLYEGNAVLHPRGSEYQTQLVIDGIPLTDNRSPGFAPEIDADDLESMNVFTAGIPAEYGRKMGGVVEMTTEENSQTGFHGRTVVSGGSFDTASGFVEAQYVEGKNFFGISAEGANTQRYLNPVVPENFKNGGTTGDFSLSYERQFTQKDHLTLSVRHELSRFEIPNERLQESAGQLQNADNFETMGIVSYEHIFSPDVVSSLRGMVRDDSSGLWSNAPATPIIAFQHNRFREGYFKGSISVHHGIHEFKAGVESDNIFLHEDFRDRITDPTQFDDGTPLSFAFLGNHPDLEQSAFVQDLIHWGDWTFSAGLRWDHYQLLVSQNAFSPRVSVGRYFRKANLVVHASYDRVFQTPEFDNILLASSPAVSSLNPNVLRLPVRPSNGNYYEGGITKGLYKEMRLTMNVYRRAVSNYADDDQLLNTAVSFPIAFDRSVIYGAEAKIDLPHWGPVSGFFSYSYMVGFAWFPVTGGLFVGDDALDAKTQLTGHFPDSQDQRNTFRTRYRWQIVPKLWAAAGADYGSGLPFEFQGTEPQALAQYGPQVVGRVNFDRGRVKPQLSVNLSAGGALYSREKFKATWQFDVENLNNRLNIIDFGGLFSGDAIGPPRSYTGRISTNF
jgi:hypothetical protein